MRTGRFEKRSSFVFNKKSLVLLLALVLVVGGVVGGTLAWLTAVSTPVKNTFTSSDIDVELEETTEDFQMIPGWTIAKDPKTTVSSDSEDCWLFVKVEENCTVPNGSEGTYAFSDFLEYEIADGWTQLTEDQDGNSISEKVYYRKVDNTTSSKGTPYSVLKDDQVAVKGTVTKEMMKQVTTNAAPTLTFTAYAFQLYKTNKPASGATKAEIASAQFTAAEAWANINNSN